MDLRAALGGAFHQRAPPVLIAASGSHPLLIHRTLFAEAAACSDAIGLRQLVQRRTEDLRQLPCDAPDAEADLDRPEDLWLLKR